MFAREAGALEGHPDIVALGHRDVLGAQLCPHLSGGRLAATSSLRLRDLADHPGELVLYKLVRSDGLVAPLLAENGILQRAIIAGHGSADRTPGNAVAGLVQATSAGISIRRFWAASLTRECERPAKIALKLQRRAATTCRGRQRLKSRGIGFDQKTANLIVFVFPLLPR